MITLNAINKSDRIADVQPGIYRHYKTGNRYEVIGVSRYSEDPEQEFVVYKQLYESVLRPGDKMLPYGTLWHRPKKMFSELVTNDKGEKVPRFERIIHSKL